MTATAVKEVLINVVLVGLVAKIAWDWLKAGRAEKGVYLLVTDCQKFRAECNSPAVKMDLVDIKTRLKETEKQLDQGRERFDKLMDKISSLEKKIEGLIKVWEYSIEMSHKEGDC